MLKSLYANPGVGLHRWWGSRTDLCKLERGHGIALGIRAISCRHYALAVIPLRGDRERAVGSGVDPGPLDDQALVGVVTEGYRHR